MRLDGRVKAAMDQVRRGGSVDSAMVQRLAGEASGCVSKAPQAHDALCCSVYAAVLEAIADRRCNDAEACADAALRMLGERQSTHRELAASGNGSAHRQRPHDPRRTIRAQLIRMRHHDFG